MTWRIYAGDTQPEVLEFIADGVPWDMTGCTLSAEARETVSSETVALTATCEEVSARIGQWRIVWPGDEARTVLAGAKSWQGVYDVQVTQPGGAVVTVIRGTLTVMMDVTRGT
jgi:hypothetical protein